MANYPCLSGALILMYDFILRTLQDVAMEKKAVFSEW